MWTLIHENLATIAVLFVVALAVGGAVASMLMGKRKGGSACGSCAGCAHADKCRGR